MRGNVAQGLCGAAMLVAGLAIMFTSPSTLDAVFGMILASAGFWTLLEVES